MSLFYILPFALMRLFSRNVVRQRIFGGSIGVLLNSYSVPFFSKFIFSLPFWWHRSPNVHMYLISLPAFCRFLYILNLLLKYFTTFTEVKFADQSKINAE